VGRGGIRRKKRKKGTSYFNRPALLLAILFWDFHIIEHRKYYLKTLDLNDL
jgi:hypothetical protein